MFEGNFSLDAPKMIITNADLASHCIHVLRDWINVPQHFTFFVAFCLLSCTSILLLKGVYSKRKSLASLAFNTMGKIFRRHFEIFFLFFSPENRIWYFMQTVNPMETICMKCQIQFSGKNEKNVINFSSAELAQRVVKVRVDPFSEGRKISFDSCLPCNCIQFP